MGGGPDECPERYAVADPYPRCPSQRSCAASTPWPTIESPLIESVSCVAAAQAAGQDARLHEVHDKRPLRVDLRARWLGIPY